jgi:microcystin-dependent protein
MSYSNGQGLAGISVGSPDGDDPYSTFSGHIRDIKAYLLDPTVGPEAKCAAVASLLQSLQSQAATAGTYPVGSICIYSGSINPGDYGWLLCDGRAVSRTTYSALFTAIGVICGAGDQVSTFNLPDFRGRVAMGADRGANRFFSNRESTSASVVLGEKTGSEYQILAEPHAPVHVHPWSGSAVAIVGRRAGGLQFYGGWPPVTSTEPAGESQPHENSQPTKVINYYIKHR